jgi:hypothetical protein
VQSPVALEHVTGPVPTVPVGTSERPPDVPPADVPPLPAEPDAPPLGAPPAPEPAEVPPLPTVPLVPAAPLLLVPAVPPLPSSSSSSPLQPTPTKRRATEIDQTMRVMGAWIADRAVLINYDEGAPSGSSTLKLDDAVVAGSAVSVRSKSFARISGGPGVVST